MKGVRWIQAPHNPSARRQMLNERFPAVCLQDSSSYVSSTRGCPACRAASGGQRYGSGAYSRCTNPGPIVLSWKATPASLMLTPTPRSPLQLPAEPRSSRARGSNRGGAGRKPAVWPNRPPTVGPRESACGRAAPSRAIPQPPAGSPLARIWPGQAHLGQVRPSPAAHQSITASGRGTQRPSLP